ncbi:MAG: aconitase X, partial [Candidatus Ranarchaeia archaeon]
MFLTREEEGMLNGEEGPGVQAAMTSLVKIGDAVNAEKMVQIRQAHASYTAWFIAREPGLEWLENLASLGAKARVPLTSQCAQFDLERWEDLRETPDIVEKQKRLCNAHLAIGSAGTWTCSPYVIGNQPLLGAHLASVESSAVPVFNGIFGARTIRNVGQTAILAAICGRTPYFDMHITDNRKANALVKVEADINRDTELDYTLLGYWIGEQLGNKNPCIEG